MKYFFLKNSQIQLDRKLWSGKDAPLRRTGQELWVSDILLSSLLPAFTAHVGSGSIQLWACSKVTDVRSDPNTKLEGSTLEGTRGKPKRAGTVKASVYLSFIRMRFFLSKEIKPKRGRTHLRALFQLSKFTQHTQVRVTTTNTHFSLAYNTNRRHCCSIQRRCFFICCNQCSCNNL